MGGGTDTNLVSKLAEAKCIFRDLVDVRIWLYSWEISFLIRSS